MRAPLLALVGLLCAGIVAGADKPLKPDALEIIQTAYDRMLNYPSVRNVTLQIHRDGRRVTHRTFDVVYQELDGRGHTLLKFTAPDYLRDSGLLVIERSGGNSDSWIYRPSDRRPRRVSVGQKGDSFYGSDLAIEDLEHHDWRLYELERLADAEEQGRPCWVVKARPRSASGYSRIQASVDREDYALLRVDFFRGDESQPFKALRIDRQAIVRRGGVFEPRWMEMRQHGRDAYTRVEFNRIEIDPEITSRTFSVLGLERRTGRSLFELVKEAE